MSVVSLFEALWQVVPWQIRPPVARDMTLLQNAEFQILLCELRYPPIRRLYESSVMSMGSTDPDKNRKR
jgi:hypothetical protein